MGGAGDVIDEGCGKAEAGRGQAGEIDGVDSFLEGRYGVDVGLDRVELILEGWVVIDILVQMSLEKQKEASPLGKVHSWNGGGFDKGTVIFQAPTCISNVQ